jgi:hypothetical protein
VGASPLNSVDPFGLLPSDICGTCSTGDTNCLLYGGNLCFPGHDVGRDKFPAHGNWCGPGWTAGRMGSWDDLTPHQRENPAPAVDDLDASCKTHDICYSDCRKQYPCDAEMRSQCFSRCDSTLKTDAYGIGGVAGRLIGRAMDRPGARNPGPNAPSCGCGSK